MKKEGEWLKTECDYVNVRGLNNTVFMTGMVPEQYTVI